MRRFSASSLLLAAALGSLALVSCQEAATAPESISTPQGLEGFFNPQVGEAWTYAVTRDTAPGLPTKRVDGRRLSNGATRTTFERRRICTGLARPDGAEHDLTAFDLLEDGELVEHEYYDITAKGFIGRGWAPANAPASKGVLLTPGVTIALPGMSGGQSWTAPGTKSGPIFNLDVIERTDLTVPAGTFETTRIRLTTETPRRSTKRTVWFAENIGIVKEEVVHYGADRISIREHLVLTKWSIPSKPDPNTLMEPKTANTPPQPGPEPTPTPETEPIPEPIPLDDTPSDESSSGDEKPDDDPADNTPPEDSEEHPDDAPDPDDDDEQPAPPKALIIEE